MPEREFVQLGTAEALFSGKAAAENIFNHHDLAASAGRDGLELVDCCCIVHATHPVNRKSGIRGLDGYTGQHGIVNELDAVLHCESPIEIALHAICAWAGVENDRPPAVFAGLAQCNLQLRGLAVGRRRETLALERLATAKL